MKPLMEPQLGGLLSLLLPLYVFSMTPTWIAYGGEFSAAGTLEFKVCALRLTSLWFFEPELGSFVWAKLIKWFEGKKL
jgi:hypothetical protein